MTRYEHQKRYAKKQRAKRGLVQVAVWVPEKDRATLICMAKEMRQGYKTDTVRGAFK